MHLNLLQPVNGFRKKKFFKIVGGYNKGLSLYPLKFCANILEGGNII